MQNQKLTSTNANFRTDINGLRAFAVVTVILYHFGVFGFRGGFVGVDVFFVISGFLMTGIVVKGFERGQFSLVDFYMARARRIVPALIAVCIVLLGLGWFLLLPPDYKILGTHVISALGFFSNFKFWNEAGYFDTSSHEKWLLHTWSLSVEWQFYLILPIALWVVWRIKPGRTAQFAGVLAGLALSLGASMLTTDSKPVAAYFLLHTRAWEMLAGGLVFLRPITPRLLVNQGRWLEATGLALILLAVFSFDTNSAWPGWRAIVPVLGAVLVLATNRSSRWTGNQFAQWLGDRSYSLYLWHWPVFVTLVFAEIHKDYLIVAAGILTTMILGHLSYLWLENPTRRALQRHSLPIGAVQLTIVLIAVAIPATFVRVWDGVPGRFSPKIESIAAEVNNINPRGKECHSGIPGKESPSSPSCVYGGGKWKVVAVGDSHVSATISGLAAAGPHGDAGVVQWSYSGCQFVPGMKMALGNKQCKNFIRWASEQLKTLAPNIPIVIIGRYASSAFDFDARRLVVQVPILYSSKIYPSATREYLDEFSRQITNSACQIAKERTVYMVRPIPEMDSPVPQTMSRRMALGLTADVSVSMNDYRNRNAWVWAAQDAARDQCGIKILDPLPYLCRDGRCYGSRNGRPLYSDADHLSEFGNKLLVPMFAAVFRVPL